MNFSGGARRPLPRRRPAAVTSFIENRRREVTANSRQHRKLTDLNNWHATSSISTAAIEGDLAVVSSRRGRAVAEVSARKLAADIWQQSFFSDCGLCDRIHFEFAMEGMTKWDPRCSNTSVEADRLGNHMRLREDQVQTVSTLKAKLLEAQLSIHELETERDSSKKKVQCLFRKLREENTFWKSREKYKLGAVIDAMNHELSRERKKQERLELVNSKLIKLLAEAKFSEKKLMQDFDEATKARNLLEEICNELAKKVGEGELEIEALKSKLIKLCEEVEEERKMLQMAEVWREERVQMKLVDAKLALEAKYSQMHKLVTDLETFLGSRSTTMDVMELRKAELIRQAAKSVIIQDMKEFSYAPSKSGDIYSVLEEIQQMKASERDVEGYDNHSPSNGPSNHQILNPEANEFDGNSVVKHSNYFSSYNNLEEDLSWKTNSPSKDQHSNYSHERSEPLVNRDNQGKDALPDGKESDENRVDDSPKTEIIEVCLVSGEEPKQKLSSMSRHHRVSSFNRDGDRRLSDGTISTLDTVSLHRKSDDGGHQNWDLTGCLSSSSVANPHINRGIKGETEWLQSTQKNSMKAKHLQSKMESKKTHLHNLLR